MLAVAAVTTKSSQSPYCTHCRKKWAAIFYGAGVYAFAFHEKYRSFQIVQRLTKLQIDVPQISVPRRWNTGAPSKRNDLVTSHRGEKELNDASHRPRIIRNGTQSAFNGQN